MFERKKIQLETLGEYLKQVREDLKLSEAYVISKTGIKPKFLKSLEAGDYENLPPDVYVFGFLKEMASLYSVDPNELVNQYKKEKKIQQQLEVSRGVTSSWVKRKISSLVITPRRLSVAVGLVFMAATVAYIIWQVASINRVPNLEIFEPKDRQIVKESYVVVRGKTDPGMTISVNNENVFVDQDGIFKIQLGVSNGPKELTIMAKNKFDTSVSKTISIVGESEYSQAGETQVEVKIDFKGVVELEFSLDDGPVQKAQFQNGETKILLAKKKVLVSTSDAGLTLITLNGQMVGPLGRPGEKLTGIPFFPESGTIKE